MLKKFILLSLLYLCSGQVVVFAQTTTIDKSKEIPPWMENVDMKGRSTYLIPKGAKIERITAGHMLIEPPNEYAARRFFEVEEHLNKVEQRQDDAEKQLEELKKELEELRQQCTIQQQSPRPEDIRSEETP